MNRYRVRLFARYAELIGTDTVEVDLPPKARVADLVSALRALPGGNALPRAPFVAVNLAQAGPDIALDPGDDVALLPPLAGG
ncbi:MAG: MoaD/ThiS family protein [Gemmatimonadales bacterium]